MWYFIHFREVAIQRLSEGNNHWHVLPTEKVALARAYKVPQWLLQGLRELAERKVLVSHCDAKIIGFETAFNLAHIGFGAAKTPNKHISTKEYRDWVEPQVAATFDDEFQELMREASMYTPNLDRD